ncbi:MAG: hypothetical protein CL840_22190 [Crocinitomicaceae bacterium]|nr:hypothetical protein [Crocinitomicaceae bacterium]|tara:strand:- start:17921 stop:18649 length:729 start_codon:yes stop_codon:yes gene_type:complete
MSRIPFILGLFLITVLSVRGQWVRDDDTSKVWLSDGVYMTQDELLNNSPAYFWLELTADDWRFKDSLRRRGVLAEVNANPEIKVNFDIRERYLIVSEGGKSKIIEKKSIWGICVNGIPYRYVDRARRENLIMINVLGTISYLTYEVVYEDPFYWSADVTRMEPQYRNERVDQIIDFEKKDIYRNTKKNLEKIIERDSFLYERYLLETKKTKAIYEYAIKYNNRHPINFSQNYDPDSNLPDKP